MTLESGAYTIYLDGYKLTAPKEPYFTVKAGASLTIKDRTNDLGRIVGKASDTNANIMFRVYGKLQLDGGTITGHVSTASGTVRVDGGGTFEMTGGIITGNTAKIGGAVYANGSQADGVVTNPATVTISGGTITGNTVTSGGSALYMNASIFTMTGGRIFGNMVQDNGQSAANKSTIRTGSTTLDISGGVIGDESADSAAICSVMVGTNSSVPSTLTVSGDARILGGGIQRQESSCTASIGGLTMKARVLAQSNLSYDPADENVEEYQDSEGLWCYEQVRTLRVLSIGNSYSRDSFYYLTHLSQAVGLPIEAAYLYKGSCTIREHANLLAASPAPSKDTKDPGEVYDYYKADLDPDSPTYGSLLKEGKVNAVYALMEEGNWDVVMLHQGTTAAGFAGSYNSDIDYLVDAIRDKQPNAKLYWNMIWAFDDSDGKLAANSDRAKALSEYYNNDQATMYNAILQCTADNFIGEDAVYAKDFEGWFPVGHAIQTVRSSFGVNNLTRDGYHLSLGGGRLTAAMTILSVLRPEAKLSEITAEKIAPYLVTTDDPFTTEVEEYSDVFDGNESMLASIRAAVTAATADLSKAPDRLSVDRAEQVQDVTENIFGALLTDPDVGTHSTVAQVTAPMKLHFPDVACLADGTVIVGAYENVDHTPTTDATKTGYNGFGSQGAGRLVIWTGDVTASSWSYDKPLLVIDQQLLEEWGIVTLSNRYERLSKGEVTATTYYNFSDPRDPNMTTAMIDMDGDGDKEEVLMLTFWVRNFQAGSASTVGTYMTWSTDGGQTWAKAQRVTAKNRLKRGDMAVFEDGYILIPTYSGGYAYNSMIRWDVDRQEWVEEWESEIIRGNYKEQTDDAGNTVYSWSVEPTPEFCVQNEVEVNYKTGAYFKITEVSLVAPNAQGDVVYAFARENGLVLRSDDRGKTWTRIANEDNKDTKSAYTTIGQPGFAVIDSNRVYATWALIESPRNTVGKVFEVNNPGSWAATKGEMVYAPDGYSKWLGGNKGNRDAGDPSAELLADGKTMFVVSYDTHFRSIVGSKIEIEQQIKSLSGTVTGGRYTLAKDTTLSGNITVSGYLTIDLNGYKLSGGTITVRSGATLAIEDGEQTGELACAVVNSGLVTVTGGHVTGALSGSGAAAISGGTFAFDPTDRLAKDNAYVVKETDGKFAVEPGLVSGGSFINFGSSLALQLPLAGENGVGVYDSYTVKVNGTEVKDAVNTVAIDAQNEPVPVVAINDIPARKMRDEITVTVEKNGDVYYTETVSVYNTAKAWYDAGTFDQVMLADMLNYGDEAHKALDNKAYTYDALPGTEREPAVWSAVGSVPEAYGEKVAYTLSLRNRVTLNVYINAAGAQVSEVTFGDTVYKADSGWYRVEPVVSDKGAITRIVFDNIDVVNAKDKLSFTVKLSDTESFDMSCGIPDFVAAAMASAQYGQKAVVQALQKYVDSVIRVVGKS